MAVPDGGAPPSGAPRPDVAAGLRIGSFQFTSLLGAGGMGEVWRARDTALDRDVAIKVLLAACMGDRDCLRRFEQEARAASQLNHPNILSVFAVGTLGDAPYLVTELLEGETLEQRLRGGRLSPRKTVEIGAQIARGLAAAHEHGITHRDVKPANIFVTGDGRVKILDFGVAKLTPAGVAMNDTRTAVGAIVGTIGYMSPEQVRGETVDARADLFSFGAVLYEMLTGRRAFGQQTTFDLFDAIVHADVAPLDGVPPSLSRIVLRCLEKKPAERFQSARDLAFQLDGIALSTDTHPGATPSDALRRSSTRALATRILPWGVAGAASIAAIVMAVRAAPPPGSRFTETAGAERRFIIDLAATPLDAMERSPVAVSTDGAWLAYIGRDQRGARIYLRSLNELTARAVAGTDQGVSPFFSPDGKNLAFFTTTGLMRVALSGGPAIRVTAAVPVTRGGVWTRDNVIYYAPTQHSGIFRVSADGGEPVAVTESDAEARREAHLWPDVTDDGSVLVYVARGGDSFDQAHIMARSLRTGDQRVVVDAGTFAKFAPGGRLLFARGATLFAAAFDSRTLSLSGPAAPVLDGVQMDPHNGASYYAVGHDGTLVYAPGDARPVGRVLLWRTVDGAETRAFPEERAFTYPRVSPDGRTATVTIEGAHQDVWRFDLGRPVLTRLTSSPSEEFGAVWSRDGTHLAFSSIRPGRQPEIFVKSASTLDGETRLAELSAAFPNAWMPDNTTVLATVESPATASRARKPAQLMAIPRIGAAQPFAPSPYDRFAADVSADGRHVAFVSDDGTGRAEVFVATLPAAADPVQASVGGGTSPVWARDASRLFYRNGDAVLSVDVTTGPRLSTGPPRTLFHGTFEEPSRPDWPRNYDVAPDGRFLFVRPSYTPRCAQLVVVFNWRGEAIEARR